MQAKRTASKGKADVVRLIDEFNKEKKMIAIDDLTYGQLKEIAGMFGSVQAEAKPHPFVGKYVIARCYSAGVHAGEVVSVDGYGYGYGSGYGDGSGYSI